MNKKSIHLHIFGQSHCWDTSAIIGNREALTQLRNAIDKALKSKNDISAITVSDTNYQEYDIMVIQNEDLSVLKLPYYLEDKEALDYWDFLTPEQQDEMQEYWDLKEHRISAIKKKQKKASLIEKLFKKGR
jgi:hypothetical protein